MEKISRKTLLTYGAKSESVFVNAKVDDLKSRSETYFRIVPKKFFLSYKGLIFIYEDPVAKDEYKKLAKVERKLEEIKVKNNERFIKYYKQALKEDNKEPVKVKILDLKRWWDVNEQDEEEDKKEEVGEVPEPTAEEIAKVAFVYLFKVYDKLEFDMGKIKDMPLLIKSITEQIRKEYEESGKEFHEPYCFNITNSRGKLKAIKNIDQIYEIVREFPNRQKVYFVIKPYFEVGPSEIRKKDKIVESKEVVSELSFRESGKGGFNAETTVLSEQHFLDTLDEVTQSRIKQVKELTGDKKTDKEIYNMLNEMDGDVDDVCDAIWDE